MSKHKVFKILITIYSKLTPISLNKQLHKTEAEKMEKEQIQWTVVWYLLFLFGMCERDMSWERGRDTEVRQMQATHI